MSALRWLVLAAVPLAGCTATPGHEPLSTEVFVAGEGGHAIYRIPAIVRLQSGELLVFAEGRDSTADNGSNDLVMRRSADQGRSWSPIQVVLDLPGRSLNNPCVVQVAVGPRAGRVLLMFQSYPTGCGEGCVRPGFDPATACLTLLTHSDDGGRSWSEPRDLGASVKRGAPVTSVATGPGAGIQLLRGPHAGRLLMPFNQGPPGRWRVYAAWSDDGGDTWSMGDPAEEDGAGHANEVQFAERSDGSVLLVARQFDGGHRRKVAFSEDGGLRWSRLEAAPELVDPSCMGGLVAVHGDRDEWIVCTGPSSPTERVDGRAWFSADGGRTWPRSVPVADGFFAYSVPVQLAPDRIGVLHERDAYRRISFVTVQLPARDRQ